MAGVRTLCTRPACLQSAREQPRRSRGPAVPARLHQDTGCSPLSPRAPPCTPSASPFLAPRPPWHCPLRGHLPHISHAGHSPHSSHVAQAPLHLWSRPLSTHRDPGFLSPFLLPRGPHASANSPPHWACTETPLHPPPSDRHRTPASTGRSEAGLAVGGGRDHLAPEAMAGKGCGTSGCGTPSARLEAPPTASELCFHASHPARHVALCAGHGQADCPRQSW